MMTPRILRKCTLPLLLMLLVAFLPSAALPFEGPLQVKNEFPLFLHLNVPYLQSASIENSVSASFSYSSVFMVKSSPQWSMGLDMEVAELTLRAKKTIGDSFELGVDVPFLSFNSGFMDNFLESYHRFFGFPDYGRSSRPSNEFLYEVRRDGSLVVKGEGGGIGIGDIRLSAKKIILNGDPRVSVTADLELPTGNAKKGYGNGSFDAGVGLLIDKRLSEKVKAYGNFGIVFPGHLKGYETINLRQFVYGGAAVEAEIWKSFSVLGQMLFQRSPFPRTEIGSVDRISALLSFGGRYVSGNNSLEFSITEDPNTAGAPDVTFNLSFKRRF